VLKRPTGSLARIIAATTTSSNGTNDLAHSLHPASQLYQYKSYRRVHTTQQTCFSNQRKTNESHLATDKFMLWDSLSESMKEVPLIFEPGEEECKNSKHRPTNKNKKALAWYTCGPTTYSAMHLGHARTYVWLDMMRRVLEFVASARGVPPPLFVMNITDIDDKILAASEETKQTQPTDYQSPMSISRRAEARFWKDMDRLGCQRPHITTRVTEYVESSIIPYIDHLVHKDMAYVTRKGVYFDVASFEEKLGSSSKYGKLAGKAVSSSPHSTTHDSPVSEKRDQRDFALWKARKDGEEVYWSSPWGDGRPGWHIECSAMIEAVQRQFQDTHKFLIHAGGWDLKFPHHTNEIAQAEAYHHGNSNGGGCACPLDHYQNNKEWIPHWVHTGHLMIKDAKMSKSLNNFLTVEELWFDYDTSTSSPLDSPVDDFRLWCLMGGSYAHREEYSRSKILLARQNREKMLRFLLDGERWVQQCTELAASEDCIDTKKRWGNADTSFFATVASASAAAHQALLNNMQGTKYAESLLRLSEAGSAHIRQNKAGAGTIVEPVKAALQSIRSLLALVGFSELTVRAGLQSVTAGNGRGDESDSGSYIVGGETAVIEELVRFRAAVRTAALKDVKSKNATDNVKAILMASDQLRDALSKIGLEIMDNKKDVDAMWRFCAPAKDEKV